VIQKGNFKAHLELHSVNIVGCEAITFTHCHERVIHAEFMTHRSASRNASSSRAIPWRKMKAWIMNDPAMPLHFGTNKAGMQAGAEIDDVIGARAKLLKILYVDIDECEHLVKDYELHKEIVNRFIEAFGWINVVSTWPRAGFMNFCGLRMTPFAEPRIQRLAVNMAREYVASRPTLLDVGDWHMPFVKDLHRGPINLRTVSKEELGVLTHWSVARSAWVSYKTVDDKIATYEQAKARHDDCVRLAHATPTEHPNEARGDTDRNGGNMPGYNQYRHMIPNESFKEVDLVALLEGPYKDRDFIIA
jgi:thymidylate synthase ThyX